MLTCPPPRRLVTTIAPTCGGPCGRWQCSENLRIAPSGQDNPRCEIYSMNTNQAAIIALFLNRYVGNLTARLIGIVAV